MIYQRHIPREELFVAQLETLMQNGRVATLGAHLIGMIATALLFWQYLPLSITLLWAAAFTILLLLRSLQMSNALVERLYQTRPRRVYWQLIIGTAVTGAIWSAIYIYAATRVPITVQYMLLLIIVMITRVFGGIFCGNRGVLHCLCFCLIMAYCMLEPRALLGPVLTPPDRPLMLAFRALWLSVATRY